jgi:ParB-like chromosome segregation protein Spo0J
MAALKLGLDKVPVHVAIGLTPAQVKAYRIADNQTASLSQWNEERLVSELAALQNMDFDLNLTGFSGEELLRLLDSSQATGLVDPDDIPDAFLMELDALYCDVIVRRWEQFTGQRATCANAAAADHTGKARKEGRGRAAG